MGKNKQITDSPAGSAFDRLRRAQEIIEAVERFTPKKIWQHPPTPEPWRPTSSALNRAGWGGIL